MSRSTGFPAIARFLGLVTLVWLAGGCLEDDPNHCANQDGDATCASLGGGGFCSRCVRENAGCMAEEPEAACYAPGLGGMDDAADDGKSESETGGDSTGGPEPLCTEAGALDAACPEDTPFCVGEECVSCVDGGGDVLCSEEAPICFEGTAKCEACTPEREDACGEGVCGREYECRECNEHSDCLSGCDIGKGECFVNAKVIWVDQATCDPNGTATGSENDPFCRIDQAGDALSPGLPNVIRIVGGGDPYTGRSLNISNSGVDPVVAVIGENQPVVTSGFPVLSVTESSRIFVQGVNFLAEDTSVTGIECRNLGNLWLDDVRIDGFNRGIGVERCEVRIRRSTIVNNSEVGIYAGNSAVGGGRGAYVRLESSFIARNGSSEPESESVALEVRDEATMEILYSTIADNLGGRPSGTLSGKNLFCLSGAQGFVRNSVVVAPGGGSVRCPFLEYSNNFIDTDDLGESNSYEPDFNPTWFRDLENLDLHINFGGTTPFADVAVWQAGDPLLDVDRAPRPFIPGTSDFAGADVP